MNNWLYAQVAAIAEFAVGPDGREQDISALRNLSVRLLAASDRIEDEIERRLDARQTAGVSRWS